MDHRAERELVAAVEGRFFGKFRGVVAGHDDPQKRGRLLVRVPAVLGEFEVWAMPCVPFAGDKVGMFFLPPKDAGVWVEFEAGDPSYPIWSGCFWLKNELDVSGYGENKRLIKTKEFTLEIDDDAGTLTVSSNVGNASIDLTRNQVSLEAAGEVSAKVKGRKTVLNVQKFDVNNGALEVT